jgi:hypothetical protein
VFRADYAFQRAMWPLSIFLRHTEFTAGNGRLASSTVAIDEGLLLGAVHPKAARPQSAKPGLEPNVNSGQFAPVASGKLPIMNGAVGWGAEVLSCRPEWNF